MRMYAISAEISCTVDRPSQFRIQTGRCLVIDNACADPESFVREGPTLTTFSFLSSSFFCCFLVDGG